MAKQQQELEIDGRKIAFSNADKVLYPGSGFTKKQVLDYYLRVAKYLLPHLKNRPITMKRFPDGVHGKFFYEKNAPKFTPDWIETTAVLRQRDRKKINYIVVNSEAVLAWLANLACLEIHPFLHCAPDIDRPTMVVFDLDPGKGIDLLKCGEVALLLRDVLAGLGLESLVKVSGSKGLQIYIPMNTELTYDQSGGFAHALARIMEERYPDRIVSKMSKALRDGKVFIDWSQNSDFKTTISVYSLRAKSDTPYVSLPVRWDELKKAIKAGDAAKLYFEPDAALKRLSRVGDLFEPVLQLQQQFPKDLTPTGSKRKKPAAKRAGPRARESKSSAELLENYRDKRDFSKTPEPSGAKNNGRHPARPRFVIQKHDATRLHYDFRLEMDGVLKSWAVPKGVPLVKGEKRLAVQTEDHPVGYYDFEGTIPKGQYGGGTVMVWDLGTYTLIEGDEQSGHLKFRLDGLKLKDLWLLTRTRSDGSKPNWLLIKIESDARELPDDAEDQSALTGRTMQEIAGISNAEWQSNRASRKAARFRAIDIIEQSAKPKRKAASRGRS